MVEPVFIEGNTAVVTGAALGIGRATAIELAKRGMSLAITDLPGDDLAQVEQELVAICGADKTLSLHLDLSESDAASVLHATVTEKFGSVNVLMNNAVSREGRTFDGTTEQWKKLFDINVWALVDASRRFMPAMLASGERCAIINVGSKQGITNPPGTPAYNMAKAAVKIFTEQLEHELRNSGTNHSRVTSHLLVPGWTTTGKNPHKQGAWMPGQVVNTMIDAIDSGSFYIVCPDDEVTNDMDNRRIIWGAQDITHDRPPLSRWHSAFKEEAGKACS